METTTENRSSNFYRMQQTIAPITGLPTRNAIAIGDKHRAFISFVHDPANFYVQFADEQQTHAKFAQDLTSLYSKCEEPCLLARGTLVMTPLTTASQGTSDIVHRGVIEWISNNKERAVVRLIDIGYSATLPTNLLKPLVDRMKQTAPFALKCGLHGMKSAGRYTVQEKQKFMNMFFDDLNGRELTVMGTVVDNGVQLVHILSDDGQNMSHVYRAAITEQDRRLPSSSIAESLSVASASAHEERYQALSVDAEVKRHNGIDNDNDMDMERPSSSMTAVPLGFPRQAQRIGVAEVAMVVDSTNPNKISVQLSSAHNQLVKMSQRLYAIYADPITAPPVIRFPLTEGQQCVAQFAIDKRWYRAEVMRNMDVAGPIEVCFVDYGNCETCDPQKVREVADDDLLLGTPALSVFVRITGVGAINDDVWSIAQDIFEGFAADSSITLVGVDADGVYQAEFTHKNGSKLSTVFISGNLAAAPQDTAEGSTEDQRRPADGRDATGQRQLPCLELPFDTGDFIDAMVTARIESETIVFVQPLDREPQACDLLLAMQTWNDDDVKTLDSILPGSLCAAVYPADELWYRAIVQKQTDGENYEVFFVDYGDSATVKKDSLRVLPDKWTKLPALAFPIQVVNDVPSVEDIVVIELNEILDPSRTLAAAFVHAESQDKSTNNAAEELGATR